MEVPVVYVAGPYRGHYKIGFVTRTSNLTSRINTLRHMLDTGISLIKQFPGDGFEMEQRLQLRFATRRVCGEWFNLTESDLETISKASRVMEIAGVIPEEEAKADHLWRLWGFSKKGYDTLKTYEYRNKRRARS